MKRPGKKELSAADAIASQLAVESALKERRTSAEIVRLRKEREGALRALKEAEGRFDQLLEIDGGRRPLSPWEPRKGRALSTDKRVASAVVALSDVHPEEDVDPAKVNGQNRFNPAICSFRMQRHREGVEWLVREQQGMFTIKDLYLWLGGDLISGYIHEELVESNHLSPTEATLFIMHECSDTIRYLLRAFPEMQIHVLCNYGNHGRTTLKPRIATGAKNSYEWMMYHALRKEFAAEKRADFDIAGGELLYTQIYGLTLRTTHGDATRFNGGVHGLSIPLGKAVMKWNQSRQAHITMMGHYHTYFSGEELVVNNCVIGYNSYAVRIQAQFSAPGQALFLIDSKRGKCQSTQVWVGDYSSESKIKGPLPAWWLEQMAAS